MPGARPAAGGLADEGPLEAARERTQIAVEQVVAAGIKDLWLHMGIETPEVLELCAREGIEVRTGGCAVMYTQQGSSFHSLHKWVVKLKGKY